MQARGPHDKVLLLGNSLEHDVNKLMTIENLLKLWEIIKPFLKRIDSYCLPVSLVSVSVIAIFEKQYHYWPSVIIFFSVACIITVVGAVTFSFRNPLSSIWKGYALAGAASLFLMVWWRCAPMFYCYPILMLGVLLAFAITIPGGSSGTTK